MNFQQRPVFASLLITAAASFASQTSFAVEVTTSPETVMTSTPALGGINADVSEDAALQTDSSSSLDAPVTVRDRATSLVVNALGFIGVKYRRGGNVPATGFDCSGLVRYVFHDAWGLDLPRRAEEISHIGARVAKDQLQPGDLVFYNTLRKTVSHVGIYLGDGQFIHAPSRGALVRVEDMNQPYWTKRFSGARRVSQDDPALE
jgi:cell wall-associated NlpC family hydrolase